MLDQSHVEGRFTDWSVDGQKLLYWVETPHPGLWLIDLTTEEGVWIAPGTEVWQASISPSGDHVVFYTSASSMIAYREFASLSRGLTKLSLADFGLDKNEGLDDFLWVVEATGGIPKRVFDLSELGSRLVGWSNVGVLYDYFPYGSKNLPPPDVGPLWTVDIDSQERRNYVSSQGLRLRGSRLSPDRTKLALLKLEATPLDCSLIEDYLERIRCESGGFSLYVLNLFTDEVIKIGAGKWPAWSPDSQYVSFISYENGGPEIWTAKSDGSDIRLIKTSENGHYPEGEVFWLLR